MASKIVFLFVIVLLPDCSFQFREEENNEEDLHEGDIKLSRNQELALRFFNDPTAPLLGARGITKYPNLLWNTLVVPYNISKELDETPEAKAVILSAIKEWEESSCLKFVRRTTENDYIEFFKGGGCWSYVGRQGGMQQVSLASGCWYQGTVVHEIGHAMGFWHEQSRPDRDEHVKIVWENIPEDKKHNFRKYNVSQVDSQGVPYDYLSVMHYSSTAFGINGSVTIVAKDPSVIQLGQRVGLSPLDIKQADLLYKCEGNTTKPAVHPSPLPPPDGPDDCTFENGSCGFTNVDDDDDFDWTQRMGKTPSGNTGPETDHTTLRFGYFMYIETSLPRKPGDKAILQSKVYPNSGERCLQFYFHMYGEHIGRLKVLLSTGENDKQLWEKQQDQGNHWHLAKVQLSASSQPYRIKFLGVRGSDYKGDIAIDDIFFTDGNCSP